MSVADTFPVIGGMNIWRVPSPQHRIAFYFCSILALRGTCLSQTRFLLLVEWIFEEFLHHSTEFHNDELPYFSLINLGISSLKLLTFGFRDNVISSVQHYSFKGEECELV